MGRWIAAALLALVTVGAPAPSTAQGNTFGIIALMPPGGVDVVDVQLLDAEGVDVLELYCFEEFRGYAQYLPGYRCDSLPDGTYTVAVGERPDGWIVSEPDCLPGVEARSYSTFTVVDGQGMPGNCVFVASPPVLLLSVSDDLGVVPEASFEVRDADGTLVDLECEPETRAGYVGDWCFGVPFGELTVSLVGPAEGYRTAVYCDPELDAVNWSEEHGASITLGPERWYWSCSGTIVTPITIDFRDPEGGALKADDVGFTVKGPDGDVTDRCIPVTFPADAGGTGADSRRFHCLSLGLGSYLVEPTSDRLEGRQCIADVGPSLWGWCEFYLDPVRAPEPPVTPPPATTTSTVAPASTPTTAPTTVAPPEPDAVATTPVEGSGSGSGWLPGFLGGLVGGMIVSALVTFAVLRRRS